MYELEMMTYLIFFFFSYYQIGIPDHSLRLPTIITDTLGCRLWHDHGLRSM